MNRTWAHKPLPVIQFWELLKLNILLLIGQELLIYQSVADSIKTLNMIGQVDIKDKDTWKHIHFLLYANMVFKKKHRLSHDNSL